MYGRNGLWPAAHVGVYIRSAMHSRHDYYDDFGKESDNPYLLQRVASNPVVILGSVVPSSISVDELARPNSKIGD